MILAAKGKGVPADIWPGLGWAGGILLLALLVATVLLWRNMTRQFKKVKVPTAAEYAEQDRAARQARREAAAAGNRANAATGDASLGQADAGGRDGGDGERPPPTGDEDRRPGQAG